MSGLIRPFLQGPELVDEINATRPSAGSLAIWWLGQSGFLIKSRKGSIVIDPFLSASWTEKTDGRSNIYDRMTEKCLDAPDLKHIGLVLASHKHGDHMDAATLSGILAASPDAMLLLPCSLVAHARGLGIDHDRIWAMEAGDTYAIDGFLIRAVPSAHETLEVDAGGRHFFMGFVIEAEGLRLYHSGDTVVYEQLREWLGPDRFDVFFLPINGRDASRGVPGNMNASEAVDFAIECTPRYLVPHHFDMFAFDTAPIADFLAEAERLPDCVRTKVLLCGERWMLDRR